MITIAIDPGASGGIAVHDHTDIIRRGGFVGAHNMPETERDLTELLKDLTRLNQGRGFDEERRLRDLWHRGRDGGCDYDHGSAKAFVEEVGGYIGRPQPGSAMFKFGRNFGYILGTLSALDIPVTLIKPQKWQKQLGLGTSKGMTKTQWKNKLKAEAQRRHPKLKVTLMTADALLILDAATTYLPTNQNINTKEKENTNE